MYLPYDVFTNGSAARPARPWGDPLDFNPSARSSVSIEPTQQSGIIVQVSKIILLGVNCAPVVPSEGHVQATKLPPGNENTVSVYWAAQWTTCGLDVLSACAEDGRVSCFLEWSFSGFPFPSFITKHSLVGDRTGGVGFAGGLDWEIGLLYHFWFTPQSEAAATLLPQSRRAKEPGESLENPVPPFRDKAHRGAQHNDQLSPSQIPTIRSSKSISLRLPAEVGALPQHSLQQSPTLCWPRRHPFSPANQFGAQAQFPLPLENGNTGTNEVGSPRTHAYEERPEETTRTATPSQDSQANGKEGWTDEEYEEDVQTQIYIEILRQHQKEAQNLFVRTGDTSGLLAVARAAAEAGSGVWKPSGLSRF